MAPAHCRGPGGLLRTKGQDPMIQISAGLSPHRLHKPQPLPWPLPRPGLECGHPLPTPRPHLSDHCLRGRGRSPGEGGGQWADAASPAGRRLISQIRACADWFGMRGLWLGGSWTRPSCKQMGPSRERLVAGVLLRLEGNCHPGTRGGGAGPRQRPTKRWEPNMDTTHFPAAPRPAQASCCPHLRPHPCHAQPRPLQGG